MSNGNIFGNIPGVQQKLKTLKELEELCKFFDLCCQENTDAKGLTKSLIQAILKLFEPQKKTSTSNVEFRSISSKRSRFSDKSTKKQDLLKIEREIYDLKDELLNEDAKIYDLQYEIEEMEDNQEDSVREQLKNKKKELAKKQNFYKICEARLKNKEEFSKKQMEILSKPQGESSSGSSSEDIIEDVDASNRTNKNRRIQQWADQIQDFNPVDNQHNSMETLTRSINKLLARQTIGNKLSNFDGSSYLKWPIFFKEYKLSDQACLFSPAENVLRLNSSISGEAKKMVEMLLLTAQTPDDILDILHKKYGRPELIMEELLSKVHQLPAVESLESFENFSSTVQNVAIIADDDMAHYDQRSVLAKLINKLPAHLLTQWGGYLISQNIGQRKETLGDFSSWVQQISEIVSRVTFIPDYNEIKMQVANNSRLDNNHPLQTRPLPNQNRMCKICKQDYHPPEKCCQFQSFDVTHRWKVIQKYNFCYCCLRSHHGKCRKRKACEINNCGRFHHILLHKPADLLEKTTNKPKFPESRNEVNICLKTTSKTLLKVLPVKLKGPNGIFDITAFIDEGSTTTLLEASVADKIGLVGPVAPLCCKWTGAISRYDPTSQVVQAEISGKNSSTFYNLQNIRTFKDLDLPSQNYSMEDLIEKFPFITQVELNLNKCEKPCLLIGQNNVHLIGPRQVIQPYLNAPVLSKTKIGWTLHGPVKFSDNQSKEEYAVVCCEEADAKLHEMVKDFMKIDNLGIIPVHQDRKKSREDERALNIVKNSIRYNAGQYQVKLPWKQDEEELPESKSLAMQRLFCLERKLSKNDFLARTYCLEINKLFEKNYAAPVDPREFEKMKHIWFLPHFPVTNPNKPGKVRVVFDAAAKNHGFSLNDFLLTGPDLLVSLFGILLKFRVHKFAVVGDIKEMFNRVKIAEEDTYAQCFLWRDLNKNTPPKVYRMTAMLFGITSSPFLAQFVKNFNAEKYCQENYSAGKAITDLHYVDDYLHTFDNEEEAIETVNQVIRIHSEGGFEIRNFISNSSKILKNIPPQLLASHLETEVSKITQEDRILGMMWNSKNDCFNFNLKFHKVPKNILNGSEIPTKRQVLRTAMSVFDPLGLLSPITIRIRILLQTIWRAGIGWDDNITQNMFKKWNTWIKDLNHAMKIEIPRCYSEKIRETQYLEMHTFADASEEAYAAAIYLRMVYKNNIRVALVASKARVTPLKTLTIPRLELMAALTGVRLSQEVSKFLEMNIKTKLYWSDSRTVLNWLESEKKLPTYVAARVTEILEATDVNQWHWVPTAENVADDCTRGSAKNQLSVESSWFRGPTFLYKDKKFWPKLDKKIQEAIENIMITEIHNSSCISETLPEIKSYYTWLKLLRITARIRQVFLIIIKKNKNKNWTYLTPEDLDWAEKTWWRAVQCSCFPKDIQNLSTNKLNKTGRLNSMSVKLDSDGIIRVASRITKIQEVSIISKEPVVLDGGHPYVQKMIQHYHSKNAHQGIETVINDLRKRFLIPKIRSVVKKSIQFCPLCRRKYARHVEPKMGLLPEQRLLKYEKPFTATGIDYFGPFTVKIGRRIEKRYGVLFTCLTVRAVHVELAHSLSTDSCIMAIRRFLSRRGAVKTILSDNGTNFRGASRELLEALDELHLDTVAENMTNRGIKWKFNPPLSPFMGGSWERLIGSFKRALSAIMKDRNPTEEVLQTLFAEVEYIMNSRPLTNVSDNVYDNPSITPNDILLGKSADIITPGRFTECDLSLRKQWRISQYLADIFWKRWLREYLPTLINRTKWNTDNPNLKEGDVVIINENDFPRCVWPLGVVEKVYHGEDEIVRVADIRTKNGVFKRPVRKLYRLDINNHVDEAGVNTVGDNVKKL